jgi:hypothetical protein
VIILSVAYKPAIGMSTKKWIRENIDISMSDNEGMGESCQYCVSNILKKMSNDHEDYDYIAELGVDYLEF